MEREDGEEEGEEERESSGEPEAGLKTLALAELAKIAPWLKNSENISVKNININFQLRF
jgi:hypothetical protein